MSRGIDTVSLALAASDFAAFATRLGGALERSGFVIIEDHGLPDATIATSLACMREFFGRRTMDKLRYRIPGGGGARGYTPFAQETAKDAAHPDRKEFWHVGREAQAGTALDPRMPPNVWIDDLPDFRDAVLAAFDAFDRLGRRLLEGIAVHLGLPRDGLEDAVAGGNSVLRILHYPPLDDDGPALRAAPHGDINVITVLLGAEEAGLEVRGQDGRWIPLQPAAGSLVCHVGDMLERLTNHRLPSALHRVVNPRGAQRDRPRYSIPFFLHFRPDTVLSTLPTCIDADHPDRYPVPITAHALLQERLAAIGLL